MVVVHILQYLDVMLVFGHDTSYSSSKLNGNNFDKKINFQFRWNKILNEDFSLFTFLQTGESKRSFIDERTLIGIGLRQHIYKKDKNYFDIAVGPFMSLNLIPNTILKI